MSFCVILNSPYTLSRKLLEKGETGPSSRVFKENNLKGQNWFLVLKGPLLKKTLKAHFFSFKNSIR